MVLYPVVFFTLALKRLDFIEFRTFFDGEVEGRCALGEVEGYADPAESIKQWLRHLLRGGEMTSTISEADLFSWPP
jgi:hypothetical protein